jgi:hypothetical protein
VREALRLLSHYERLRNAQLAQLEKEIVVGVKQFERGEYSKFTDETMDEIRAEGMKKQAQEKAGCLTFLFCRFNVDLDAMTYLLKKGKWGGPLLSSLRVHPPPRTLRPE